MYKKRTAKTRADLHDRGSLEPVSAFGERTATDFIIVRKFRDGRENVVQVVRDEFSGWLRAYPTASRDTGSVVRNALSFLGPSYHQPCVMCKSDQAPEIVAACKRLCFLIPHPQEMEFAGGPSPRFQLSGSIFCRELHGDMSCLGKWNE